MAKFASAKTQAVSVMKQVQGGVVPSLGTVRDYEEALTHVATWCKEERMSLRDITVEQALAYLDLRSEEVGQKTLDMDRQAIQIMFQHVTHQLEPRERLPVIKSDHPQILKSRAYTPDQATAVASAQYQLNALSTRIAHAAGLRAHELLTLLPLSQRAPSPRPALQTKFLGMENTVAYTVHGKGGLIREVRIPLDLSIELQKHYSPPDTHPPYIDRGIHYPYSYALSGGSRWSSSFSHASKRALGWSHGAHGLRHSYAQRRMIELQVNHRLDRDLALETVSQEMGHFRPSITETYLR